MNGTIRMLIAVFAAVAYIGVPGQREVWQSVGVAVAALIGLWGWHDSRWNTK